MNEKNETTNETIRERLLKIKALYDGAATDGERDAAQAKLEQILTAHNMTLADLESPKRDWRGFTYANLRERKLLGQLWGKVTGWKSKVIDYRVDTTRRTVYYELTPAEYADMQILFAHYRKEWERMLDEFFIAFLNKHSLARPLDDDEPPEYSNEDLAKIIRARAMMKSMRELQSPLAAGYLPTGKSGLR